MNSMSIKYVMSPVTFTFNYVNLCLCNFYTFLISHQ